MIFTATILIHLTIFGNPFVLQIVEMVVVGGGNIENCFLDGSETLGFKDGSGKKQKANMAVSPYIEYFSMSLEPKHFWNKS